MTRPPIIGSVWELPIPRTLDGYHRIADARGRLRSGRLPDRVAPPKPTLLRKVAERLLGLIWG